MTSNAREEILGSIRSALKDKGSSLNDTPDSLQRGSHSIDERLEMLKTNLEAVKAEVHITDSKEWTKVLSDLTREKGIHSLHYSKSCWMASELKQMDNTALQLIAVEKDSTGFKDEMFDADAAITSTYGGIAENGSIIVWPTSDAPRSMSLVPPVHIAVLKAESIYHTLAEAMESEEIKKGLPTNLILISGPSKTADIELVLAFGVHGPKELITLVVKD